MVIFQKNNRIGSGVVDPLRDTCIDFMKINTKTIVNVNIAAFFDSSTIEGKLRPICQNCVIKDSLIMYKGKIFRLHKGIWTVRRLTIDQEGVQLEFYASDFQRRSHG